jgi:hypothetical protein
MTRVAQGVHTRQHKCRDSLRGTTPCVALHNWACGSIAQEGVVLTSEPAIWWSTISQPKLGVPFSGMQARATGATGATGATRETGETGDDCEPRCLESHACACASACLARVCCEQQGEQKTRQRRQTRSRDAYLGRFRLPRMFSGEGCRMRGRRRGLPCPFQRTCLPF